MCGYSRCSITPFTSTRISFWSDFPKSDGGIVSRIRSLDGEFMTPLLVSIEGRAISDSEYTLAQDTLITISGSAQGNDGVYKLLKRYTQNENNLYADTVFWDANNEEQSMTLEAYGASITISGGQTTCDHTLEHCRQRNNLNRFGGSPGVAGGAYA